MLNFNDQSVDSNAASIVEFIEGDLGLDVGDAVPALVRAIGDYARNAEGFREAEEILDSAANALADETLEV